MREKIEMRGALTLRLTDREGRVVHEQQRHNRIVRSGRQLVAQLFAGPGGGPVPTKVTHMAVGTSSAAPDDTQTALGAERAPRMPISEIVFADLDDPVPGGGGATVKRIK